MLVLWRRAGQCLIIGEDTEVQILDARSNRVKLGIKAPSAVPVVRKEAQLTRQENLNAAWSVDEKTIGEVLSNLRRGRQKSDTNKGK